MVSKAALIIAFMATGANAQTQECGWEVGKWVCRTRPEINWGILKPVDTVKQSQEAYERAAAAREAREERQLQRALATAELNRAKESPRPIPLTTGNNYARGCDDPNWQMACATYTVGVFNGAVISGNPRICAPLSIDNGQINAVARKFVSDNPARGHEYITPLLIEAYADAWPCKIADGQSIAR